MAHGSVYGAGVYVDLSGKDQSQGANQQYGLHCQGSFLVLAIAVLEHGNLPRYKAGNTRPGLPFMVCDTAGSSTWAVVNDASKLLVTGWLCHTKPGDAEPYSGRSILERYKNSSIPWSAQMTADGEFSVPLPSHDRLPEICVGPMMLPVTAGSTIPSQQGGPPLPIGRLGKPPRKSLVPTWDDSNLELVVPDPDDVVELQGDGEETERRRYSMWQRKCCDSVEFGTRLPDIFVPTGVFTGAPWNNQSRLQAYYQNKLSALALRINTAAPAVFNHRASKPKSNKNKSKSNKAKSNKAKPNKTRVKAQSKRSVQSAQPASAKLAVADAAQSAKSAPTASAAPTQPGINVDSSEDEDDPPSKRPKALSIPTASTKSASAAPLQPGICVNSSAPSRFKPYVSDSSDDDENMLDSDY